MEFKQAVEYRRAVRDYDSNRPLDPTLVIDCLKLAQLSPSSSNMQLYEFYHITNPDMLKNLPKLACRNKQLPVLHKWLFCDTPRFISPKSQISVII